MNRFIQKLIILIVVLSIVLVVVHQQKIFNKPPNSPSEEKIMVLSTNPSPIDGQVLLPTQNLEVTFNKPLINEPETNVLFDPVVDFKKELSLDRKTVKIILNKPYQLGQGYTFFIKKGAKFDGLNLEDDIIFHFRTINYRGI